MDETDGGSLISINEKTLKFEYFTMEGTKGRGSRFVPKQGRNVLYNTEYNPILMGE
jgi:hypothetical protein